MSAPPDRRPVTGTAAAEADAIGLQLRTGVTAERAAASKAYLKLDLHFTGASVPQVRAAVTGWRRAHKDLPRSHLVGVATQLWSRPVFECRMAAVIMLTDRRALLEAGDMALTERLLRESGTWALVDGLAADVAGSLVQRYPELHATLDRWAADADFWIRRSALLALLVPLRRGDPAQFDRFGRYADQMLDEREFFVRKAIGWVLRETAKKQPGLVTGWLAPRTDRASGVTMREAVKYLPAADAGALMAAFRQRRPAVAGTPDRAAGREAASARWPPAATK
jgi:3-methyladenine DNA glycosylase AlkD